MRRSLRWRSVTPYLSGLSTIALVRQVRNGAAIMTGVKETKVVVEEAPPGPRPHPAEMLDCLRGRRHGYDVSRWAYLDVTFPWPVAGPWPLGTLCHYGLGNFVPV